MGYKDYDGQYIDYDDPYPDVYLTKEMLYLIDNEELDRDELEQFLSYAEENEYEVEKLSMEDLNDLYHEYEYWRG